MLNGLKQRDILITQVIPNNSQYQKAEAVSNPFAALG